METLKTGANAIGYMLSLIVTGAASLVSLALSGCGVILGLFYIGTAAILGSGCFIFLIIMLALFYVAL